jgi:protein arginine kinase
VNEDAFEHFPHLLGEWLKGSGPDSDIVISTRVRFARNLDGFPFTLKASERQRGEVIAAVQEALDQVSLKHSVVTLQLNEIEDIKREILVERHLISRELANSEGPRGVTFGRGEMLSIMVNEEDHLRLQWIKAGFDIDRAYHALCKVDRALEKVLPYALSERFGYLTACPTNVGTGMRISVMLHLPALTLKEQVDKVFKAAQRMNHAVRGLYGEGTRAFGDMYQISNQTTLGRSEEAIVESVKAIVPRILDTERQMRGQLYAEDRSLLEDKVLRALAVLRSARRLNVQEMMGHLSMVRLGIDLGVISDVPLRLVNEMFILGQPSHLQESQGRKMSADERDIVRAEMVRSMLATNTN